MTADKVVAELTFGFWTTLFNKQYAKDFWKPLMYAFPLLDTPNKRRNKISYKLNHIRKFRNRIFHYEPICNHLSALATNHNNILEILNWINADIVSWTKEIDRFDNLYKQAFALRTATWPNAPSQAHLQGTQSLHTKAILAKEPALCQRSYFDGFAYARNEWVWCNGIYPQNN